jgi:hypothetical protein
LRKRAAVDIGDRVLMDVDEGKIGHSMHSMRLGVV